MLENMKKNVLFSVVFGVLPLAMMAQDDLYFSPKKAAKEAKSSVEKVDAEAPAYYVGSDRSDDEYNRLGEFRSYYEKVGTDSLGNDIIEFHPGKGYEQEEADYQYDEEDDFAYSRHMSRFEDTYCPYDAWLYTRYGFGPYWRSRFYWDYLYDPWYAGWYDPWYSYYGWYYPWYSYSPWRYGYYGWGYPYGYWGGYWGGGYWGGGGGIAYNDHGRNHGVSGTSGHGHVYRPGMGGHGGGSFGGARGGSSTRSTVGGTTSGKTQRRGTFGSNRTGTNRTWSSSTRSSDTGSTPSYGGNTRSGNSSFGGSYGGSSSGGGSSRGGSFGGGGSTRSGGGFGGRR